MIWRETKNRYCITMMLSMALGLIAIFGCSRNKAEDDYLLRCRDLNLNISDFNQAVKAASEEAFPGEKNIELNLLNDLRIRVLNQSMEEMMISAFAADQGIRVTDSEIEKAVADIQIDYPGDTFEQTLLENAISFEYWKKKLAVRLLVQKVIATELINQVQITDEDIENYYKENYSQGAPKDENSDQFDQRIITHLRQIKAEKAYKEWLELIREKYPVTVNHNAWEKLINKS